MGGGTDAGEIGLGDSDLIPSIRLYDYNNANFIKHSQNAGTTSSAMGQAISTNWVIHRIYWESATSVKYQNDSEAWESIAVAANIPTIPIEPFLMAYRGTANATLEVDYVIIRKYIGSDPVQTVGAEEVA